MAEGIDQLFDINFTEGVSKLNITIPMLINVNAYSVEYDVIGDTPNGYAVPSTGGTRQLHLEAGTK